MRNAFSQQCDFSSRFRILKGGKIALVVSAFVANVALLHASPTGGVVTAGSASISQNGSVTNITQTTQKASINWQNFSIGTSETVNFNQPNASAVTLNRVVGNEKSIIDGALNANGQVFILNSNGVLFRKNASINTAGLVATTMNLSDSDFMNGNYAFKGDSSASVINQGTLNISDKGYAALFGKEVKNEGIIKATLGKVELIGANEVTLNLNGNSLVNLKVNKGVLDALVENKGAIYADGGEVYLTTNAVNELLNGVVNNTGIIQAQSFDDVAGKIELFAHGGTVQVDGSLDATGGFIETSGKDFNIAQGAKVTASDWLIDPTNITIDTALASTLVGQLAVGSATVTTASAGSDLGDITVNADILWATNNKLTLTANNIVYVNNVISTTNTSGGGVYFSTSNALTKVVFASSGKVAIYNAEQLQWVNTALSGKYELGTNIDASATSGWNSGAGFVPIGASSTSYFSGSFNGKGYTIDHVTINRSASDNQGLFGYAKNSTINNVGLTNVNVTGNQYVGGLVGYVGSGTTLSNAYVIGGTVNGIYRVGGLVGRNYGTITNTYATDSVIGSAGAAGTTGNVGGLVGMNNGTISNSYSTGSVTGTLTLGGFLGVAGSGGTTANCLWDTQTSGQSTSAAGVGKTTAEMKALSTFSAWGTAISDVGGDSNVWRIYDGYTYPLLRSFLIQTTPTISASATKVYDGVTSVTSGSVDSWSVGSVLGTASIQSASKDVGIRALLAKGVYSTQQGYDIMSSSSTIDITPSSLTVTAINALKNNDGSAYSGGNGVTYTGLVNSETASVLGGSLTYGGTSQGATDLGDYVIAPSGLTSLNYTIHYVNGVLTIATGVVVPPSPFPVVSNPTSSPDTSHIENGTAVSVPKVVLDVSNLAMTNTSGQFEVGGQSVQMLSAPQSGSSTVTIGMQQLRTMQENETGDIRVPVMQGSVLNLLNGGLSLPSGVEQEFFMIANR